LYDFDYKTIFEHTGVALCICDKSGNILSTNHLFDNLFGKYNISKIQDIPEEGYRESFLKVIELADEGYAGVPYPFTFWTSIGTHRCKYEVNISRQPSSDYFIITISDITRRAEAYEELNRRNRELSCLIKIQQLTSSSFRLDEITRTTISESCKIFDFPIGFILLPAKDNGLRIISHYAEKEITQEIIERIEYVLNSGVIINWTKEKFKTILINERAIGEITDEEAALLEMFNVASIVSVPIIVKGEIFGFIIFGRKESYNLYFDQVSILETLAHQIGISIQNAMLFSTSEQIKSRVINQNESLNLIYRMGLLYFKNIKFEDLIKEIGDDICRITGFEGLCILYQKGEEFTVIHHFQNQQYAGDYHIDVSDKQIFESIKQLLSSNTYLFIKDIPESTDLPLYLKETLLRLNIKSMFFHSIREGESNIGVISAFTIKNRVDYSKENIAIFSTISVFIESLIINCNFKNELQNREKELSRLSKKLINAQEDEKKRIAKEIHDSLGQLIYTLNLNISALSIDKNFENNPIIPRALTIINQIQEDIRKISYSLKPPTLEEMGLISALRWLVEQVKTPSIKINLGTNVLEPIPFKYPVQVQIFRIAQEALTNILKHSRATEANIFLYENDKCFYMEITDNGIGLPEESQLQMGIGIIGMKERAATIGATLKINSSSDAGTTILLEINK